MDGFSLDFVYDSLAPALVFRIFARIVCKTRVHTHFLVRLWQGCSAWQQRILCHPSFLPSWDKRHDDTWGHSLWTIDSFSVLTSRPSSA